MFHSPIGRLRQDARTTARRPDTREGADADLLDHLTHQSALVHALLADAAAECWMWPTPAVGWTVAHHVAHLLWTDGNARHSLLGRHAFAAIADRWGRAAIIDPDVRSMMAEGLDHSDLLSRWHTDRTELVATLRRGIVGRHAEGPALPVDPEGLASVLLMETWAHGHDIADALGLSYPATGALRHIADLGVRTREFSYANRGLEAPSARIRIDLDGPDGQRWVWGPERGHTDSIAGAAEDFCFAVTQRRHLYELDLSVTGRNAIEWLRIAQTFAGEATTTPRPHDRHRSRPAPIHQQTGP